MARFEEGSQPFQVAGEAGRRGVVSGWAVIHPADGSGLPITATRAWEDRDHPPRGPLLPEGLALSVGRV